MPDEPPVSRLASPEIDERAILIVAAVGVFLTVICMAGLLWLYDTVGRGAQRPLFAQPFPPPRLETAPIASPRMPPTADPASPHGRYRVDPERERFEARIGAAMSSVAARGAGAYDPPVGATP